MRYLIAFAVFTFVVALSSSRPSNLDNPVDSSQEEAEYESYEEPAAEGSMREDGGSQLDKQEQSYAELEEEGGLKPTNREEKRDSPSSPDHRTPEDRSDESPDYKLHGDRESEDMKSNQPQPLQQRPNRYDEVKEVNELTEMPRQMANIDENPSERGKSPRWAAYNRRSVKSDNKRNELFESSDAKERMYAMNNQQSKNDADPDHEGFFKHYYKTLQDIDEKVKSDDKNYDNYPSNNYRNRRHVQEAVSIEDSEHSNTDDLKNSVHECEEIAITKHIKKLSEQELEGLLNSLPDEKRALLNKIIEKERDGHYDGVNKRDITKKAGAVEENMDIGVFDSSKLHDGSSVDVKNDACRVGRTENSKSSELHTQSPEIPKKTSGQEISSGKEEENKANVNLNDLPTSEVKSEPNVESNDLSSKVSSKRETNLNDFGNEFSSINNFNENSNDEIGYNYQNEDMSQIITNCGQQENNAIENINKREALLENTDSFKSLEESFPNTNTYQESGQYSEKDMVPLVRVKRRNDGSLAKQRSAELVPHSKISYIPYRAENDDEDSEEGNEFEDDGFYDRSSNYVKENVQLSHDESLQGNSHPEGKKQARVDISRNDNIESDTMNIGSDSDSVLSGVEGVDDNLMYNSGVRSKRAVDKKPFDLIQNDSGSDLLSGRGLNPQATNLDAANEQGNDAFEKHSENINMKRVRRAKAPCDVSSSNTNK